MCVQVHQRMRRSQRTGVTLVELVIAILLIGLLATVVVLNAPRDERASPTTSIRIAIAAARESAIDSGKAITQVITVRGNSYPVTALPDGRDRRLEPPDRSTLRDGRDGRPAIRQGSSLPSRNGRSLNAPSSTSATSPDKVNATRTPGRRGLARGHCRTGRPHHCRSVCPSQWRIRRRRPSHTLASEKMTSTRASAFLGAVALWPREDLDRHSG